MPDLDYEPGGDKYVYPDWIQSGVFLDRPIPIRQLYGACLDAVVGTFGTELPEREPTTVDLPGGARVLSIQAGKEINYDPRLLVAFRPDGPYITTPTHSKEFACAVEVIVDTVIRRDPARIMALHADTVARIGEHLDGRTPWRWALDLQRPVLQDGAELIRGAKPIGWPDGEPFPPVQGLG